MFDINLTKKYGILISGGLDSAILLALIAKDNPTVNIQPFSVPKFDGSYHYVKSIIDFINTKYNSNIPYSKIVGNPNLHHSQQNASGVREIFEKNYVDFLFIGLNQNPPELSNMPSAPKRPTHSNNPRILLPFIELYKDKILNLAYENNLEELINITHTCTEMTDTRCNTCWQCQERAWAFRQLKRIDTGKY